jgi:hypothetical protein
MSAVQPDVSKAYYDYLKGRRRAKTGADDQKPQGTLWGTDGSIPGSPRSPGFQVPALKLQKPTSTTTPVSMGGVNWEPADQAQATSSLANPQM